ncbi:DUF3795 domain-containing protein, partial [candidate division WOR-3 bacterium]|nr:DUF3795 domain-containing protein [candidate division WOR-3 bacterium]
TSYLMTNHEVSMSQNNQMIAACGLNCSKCDVHQASNDPKTSEKIANWFKRERDIEVKIEDIKCMGCKGDRTKHWSPDCWILECCIDKKGLEFCCQCEDFPCERLKEWAKGSKKYSDALSKLKEMVNN